MYTINSISDPKLKDLHSTNRDIKDAYIQWNLENTLKIEKFKFVGKPLLTQDDYQTLFKSLFLNQEFLKAMSITGSLPLDYILQYDELNVTIRDMSFFDKLDSVAPNGRIKGCYEDTYDRITVGDELREMYVNPDSPHASLYTTNEQQEFMYHLLRVHVLGGPLCQPDITIDRYLNVTKSIYKALITIYNLELHDSHMYFSVFFLYTIKQHDSKAVIIDKMVEDSKTQKNPSFTSGAQDAAEKRFPEGTVDWFLSSDFNIDYNSVEIGELIAKGSYGTVYKALWKNEVVAAKLEDFTDGDEEQVNLLVELTMLQSFPHDRLVKFLGAGCLSVHETDHTERKLMIVMEYCERGALRECLREALPWNLRTRISLDIAYGLSFLHDSQVIHRDIKSTNVLIDKDWRAKLCDFSFACHVESTSKCEVTYGTDEFMSPEVALAQDFGVAADIFSFGIVLCEIITGREPSAEFMNRKPQNCFAIDETEVKQAVLPGCPIGIESLAYLCCDVTPESRPSAYTCIDTLAEILSDLGGGDFKFETPLAKSPRAPVSPSPFREGKVRHSGGENGIMSYSASKRRFSHSQITPFQKNDENIHARLEELEHQVTLLKQENFLLHQQLSTSSQSGGGGSSSTRTVLKNKFIDIPPNSSNNTTSGNTPRRSYSDGTTMTMSTIHNNDNEGLYVGETNIFATPIPVNRDSSTQQNMTPDEGLYVGQNNWFTSPVPQPNSSSSLNSLFTPIGRMSNSNGQLNTAASTPIQDEVAYLHSRLNELEQKVHSIYVMTSSNQSTPVHTVAPSSLSYPDAYPRQLASDLSHTPLSVQVPLKNTSEIQTNTKQQTTTTTTNNNNNVNNTNLEDSQSHDTIQSSEIEHIKKELDQVRKLRGQIDDIASNLERKIKTVIKNKGGSVTPSSNESSYTLLPPVAHAATSSSSSSAAATSSSSSSSAHTYTRTSTSGVRSPSVKSPNTSTATALIKPRTNLRAEPSSLYHDDAASQFTSSNTTRMTDKNVAPTTIRPQLWPSSSSATNTKNAIHNTHNNINNTHTNVQTSDNTTLNNTAINEALNAFVNVIKSSQISANETHLLIDSIEQNLHAVTTNTHDTSEDSEISIHTTIPISKVRMSTSSEITGATPLSAEDTWREVDHTEIVTYYNNTITKNNANMTTPLPKPTNIDFVPHTHTPIDISPLPFTSPVRVPISKQNNNNNGNTNDVMNLIDAALADDDDDLDRTPHADVPSQSTGTAAINAPITSLTAKFASLNL